MFRRKAGVLRPPRPPLRLPGHLRSTTATAIAPAPRQSFLSRSQCLTPRIAQPIRPPCLRAPSVGSPSIRSLRFHHNERTLAFPNRQGGSSKGEFGSEDGNAAGGLEAFDVLSGAPAPTNSVDACLADGFRLSNGITVRGGAGVLLVNGDVFSWRPCGESREASLVNAKGQWEVDQTAFGLLSVVWPRPDLLVLGLGPEMRPLSPATRKYISSLGVRVEVLDTRNAAAQFNLLATERGVDQVAAALVPVGRQEN